MIPDSETRLGLSLYFLHITFWKPFFIFSFLVLKFFYNVKLSITSILIFIHFYFDSSFLRIRAKRTLAVKISYCHCESLLHIRKWLLRMNSLKSICSLMLTILIRYLQFRLKSLISKRLWHSIRLRFIHIFALRF